MDGEAILEEGEVVEVEKVVSYTASEDEWIVVVTVLVVVVDDVINKVLLEEIGLGTIIAELGSVITPVDGLL